MKNERLNSFSTDEPRESSAHSAEISNAMPASEHSLGYGYDNVGQLTGAVGAEAGGLLRGNENLGCLYDPAGKLLDEIKMDPLFLVSF